MRRPVAAVVALIGLTPAVVAGWVSLPAYAEPTPSAPAASSAPRGSEVCAIRDERLVELSGMAATANGFVVMNDGTDVLSRGKVFTLDGSCKVGRQVGSYPSPGQRDPEDLAIGADGSIWVADIGDDPADPRRSNIALWKFPPDLVGKVTLYRLKYPDGPHDAEALLLGPNDIPIIVTKNVGASGIYVPTGPLTPSTSTSQVGVMAKVGEFTPQRTGTSTPSGLFGQVMVTGGANSPDRKKVVLRTYSDAYEWDVPDGDVVKAITTTKPRTTPLPDEPQGEAITYSPDGASFLTVSETAELPGDQLPTILRYTPASTHAPPPAGPNIAPKKSLSWYQRISLAQLTWLIAGVGVVGVLLVVSGVIGIMRARSARGGRSRAGDKAGAASGEDAEPTELLAAVGEGYQSDYGGYSAGGYPAGGYPAGGYPAGGYPAGGHPTPEYPAASYPEAGYPAASYPTPEYPAASYPEAEYGPDQYGGYGDAHGYQPGYPPGR